MDSERVLNRFFVVLRGEFDSSYETEMLEDDPVHRGDAPRCEVCGGFVGMRPWLPPIGQS